MRTGNKLNNNLTNLKWTDHAGNMSHAFRTGLVNKHRREKWKCAK